MLSSAQADTNQLNQLLQYVELQDHPKNIIAAFHPKVPFSQVRDSLITAFKKLKIFRLLLKSAVRVSERAKDAQLKELLAFSSEGLAKFENTCQKCKECLLPESKLSDFLSSTGQKVIIRINENGEEVEEQVDNREESYKLLRTFVVFKCGHNFHRHCIKSQQMAGEGPQNEDQCILCSKYDFYNFQKDQK